MNNIILHVDINNCYASIEVKKHPEWQGMALAVCGSPAERRGIVLAKSELAKHYGVKTGETIWQARQKCPNLLVVPPHFDLYREYSQKTHDIYYRYTSQVEPFGIDECWLDVQNSLQLFGSAEEIARKIRADVKRELGISVSIGIAPTKVMAKLASDLAGSNEIRSITPRDLRADIAQLDVEKMLGVGHSTGRKLKRCGIDTIGKLAVAPEDFLQNLLGIRGREIRREARGESTDIVREFTDKEPIKSIGNGCTCRSDLVDEAEVFRVFLELAKSVSLRLHAANLYAQGVQITVKDKLQESYQKQQILTSPLRLAPALADQAMSLFKDSYNWRLPVRALTLRAYNLCSELPAQLTLDPRQTLYLKQDRLDQAIYQINQLLGEDTVSYAGEALEQKLPQNKYNLFAIE